jgi:CRP-like cAMP-binding protein
MPATDVIDALLRRLRARDKVSATEETALRAAVGEVRSYPAGKTIVREGEDLSVSILLIEGLMCRYKDLRDGRRQISALHIAGDFVDLHGFTLKRLDHSIQTMSRCRAVLFPHDRLKAITEAHPHLTRLLWLMTTLDAAIHREWELSLGCRDAPGRLAHLFCELMTRLEVVGLGDETGFELNLTQRELGECLGLTNVLVNRTLRVLREERLTTFHKGRVTMLDRAQLERLADFTPNYLYLVREPH